MSIKKRYEEIQKNQTVKMLERVLKALKANKFVVVNHGMYRAGLDGKYTIRVDVVNMDESLDLSDIQ